VQKLQAVHFAHPFYGVRRLAIHLKWSENKTRRIRNLADVRVPRPGKRYRYKRGGKAEITAPPNILHRYAVFKDETRPQDGMSYAAMVNAEAWAQDFTYLWFEQSFCYLAIVLSLKTRQVVGWRLGTSHSSELTYAALLDALSKYTAPAILHSDQGSEYLSHKHQLLCERMEIQLSASTKGSPWQNGFMERWFAGLKQELPSLSQLKGLDQLHEAIAMHIHYYNTERIHTALKMSPAAYAASLNPLNSATLGKDRLLQKKVA
jgi:transposase InsO family protein